MGFKIMRTDCAQLSIADIPVGKHILGRDKPFHCDDKNIRINHAQLDVTSDTVTVKALTKKPCIVKRKETLEQEILNSGSTLKLNIGDQVGLLPDCGWFELLYVLDDDEVPLSARAGNEMENNVTSSTAFVENFTLITTVKTERSDSPDPTSENNVNTKPDTNSALKRSNKENYVEVDIAKKIKTEIEDSENAQEFHSITSPMFLQQPSTSGCYVKMEVSAEFDAPSDSAQLEERTDWPEISISPILQPTEIKQELQDSSETTITRSRGRRSKKNETAALVNADDPLLEVQMVLATDKPEMAVNDEVIIKRCSSEEDVSGNSEEGISSDDSDSDVSKRADNRKRKGSKGKTKKTRQSAKKTNKKRSSVWKRYSNFEVDQPEVTVKDELIIKSEDESSAGNSEIGTSSDDSDTDFSERDSRKQKRSKRNTKNKTAVKGKATKQAAKNTNKKKWEYHLDSYLDDPEDPFECESDSDQAEWKPKLNIAYLKKVRAALKKKKPFWVCPDNIYLDD